MASGTTPCACSNSTAWPGTGHLPGCQYWVPIVYERTTTAPLPLKLAAKPHRCPVCEGRGTVPPGFYSPGNLAGTNHEACRTCGGTGVLWR